MQVTARLPAPLSEELDASAHRLQRIRADLIRQAIRSYLDDIEDLQAGVAALKDSADPVLDWPEVRDALLAPDEAIGGQGAGGDRQARAAPDRDGD